MSAGGIGAAAGPLIGGLILRPSSAGRLRLPGAGHRDRLAEPPDPGSRPGSHPSFDTGGDPLDRWPVLLVMGILAATTSG
jgi:hypothetical protein